MINPVGTPCHRYAVVEAKVALQASKVRSALEVVCQAFPVSSGPQLVSATSPTERKALAGLLAYEEAGVRSVAAARAATSRADPLVYNSTPGLTRHAATSHLLDAQQPMPYKSSQFLLLYF